MTITGIPATPIRVLVLIVGGALISGCNTDSLSTNVASSATSAGLIPSGSPTASTPTTPPASSNIPPAAAGAELTISGTPPTSVMVGSHYTFQPAAVSAAGAALTFSSRNLPAWASLEPATGRLTGTPTASQIGTYADIQLFVTDGAHSAALPAFSIAVTDSASGAVTITWSAPTQNNDGSALVNLAGYRIYYGTSPSALSASVNIASPGMTSYVIENLSSGTWYFAIKSFNSNNVESDLSPVVDTSI